ncbi:alpha/beta fold hydrolase [Streptomyces sp. NPDC050738]|uniref:thioesterase II family protein n=1 Tax=Streptomyces sp. NPDC050738 TaxID=3154744 RepID=UPI0034434CBC
MRHRYLAVRPNDRPADLTLLCFHHAGAGAMAYAGWQQRVGPGVRVLPVRLPGRESRLREAHITEGALLIEELEADLGPLLSGRHAFYGHSLGALVAYRFAQRRAERGLRPPERLLVGGCPAPHLPSAALGVLRPELPDGQLIAALGDENSLPGQLLSRPEMLATVLTTLRADLRLAHSLRSLPVTPLPCPLDAFAGQDDALVPAAEIRPWERCTDARFRFRTVAGAHFFVRGRELPRLVGEALRSSL